MAQTLGIVDVVWKGQNLQVEKGAKFKPGGIKNNPVTYGRAVGRAQEFTPGEVKATVPLRKGQRASDLYSAEEGELQVTCDTGQVLTWSDAFMTEIPEFTGGEGGKVELTWAVGEPEEFTVS
ncbi:phage tail tube protein [Rhodoplanes sp. TEM]|uniref:Phage tail tube protein n=1 Tax=Rhodoplanes tepidamans TaxID=200616 RepID=A0ABT5JE59_RHOTP|nr:MULTISPECIES: phage tail tube protein [Rhodoplanes]MDC7787965.1 phage tail tube protein [Rhodoplanes tepidamans]MDC7984805.1 phage tail tube protein [Rhodoplanes sp. TEM]MDQ0358394.1 hypothetical protein [Rhodoplanes tepidamans]